MSILEKIILAASIAAAYRKDFRPYLVVRTEGISVMLSYLSIIWAHDWKWRQSRALSGSIFCGMLRNIRPSGAFWRKWQSHVTGRGPVRKCPWPEVGSAHARLFPAFFFFLSSSNMATGCDQRSLPPLRGFLGFCMRNRKLRNTRSDRRSHGYRMWPKVTWPLRVPLGVRMRTRKLSNTRSDQRSHGYRMWPKVTWLARGSLGCAHAQPEVAQHP